MQEHLVFPCQYRWQIRSLELNFTSRARWFMGLCRESNPADNHYRLRRLSLRFIPEIISQAVQEGSHAIPRIASHNPTLEELICLLDGQQLLKLDHI
jgi:hypothetical protein